MNDPDTNRDTGSRIVSLLPSATEMICALGLRTNLVGVSHECDYPADVRALPAVTLTRIDHHAPSHVIDAQVRDELASRQALYSLRTDVLAALQPTLVVTQSLCDVCAVAADDVEAAAALLPAPARVYNLQPMTLDDVLDAVLALAQCAGVPAAGKTLHAQLATRIAGVRERTARIPAAARPRVAFLEWLDPPFNAGHWTPELIRLAGGIDVLGNPGAASTTLDFARIAAADPDVIVFAGCGYDRERGLADMRVAAAASTWGSLRCVRERQVFVFDGNAYFNRPGPRLADSLEVLAHALHPGVHPLPADRVPGIRA